MNHTDSQPTIALQDVTVRVGGRRLLAHTDWQINHGEHWIIWGANGAGKTTLARTLMGQTAVVQGRIRRFRETPGRTGDGQGRIAMVAPEQYHQLFQRAQFMEEMRHFSGMFKDSVCAGNLFSDGQALTEERGRWRDLCKGLDAEGLDVDALMAKPLEALSSGEMTKLLIARALAIDPHLLILDEPFNGLDEPSRRQLMLILDQLATAGIQLVLITHRPGEMPVFFTHVIHVDQGRVVWQGSKADFQACLRPDPGRKQDPPRDLPLSVAPGKDTHSVSKELVRMRHVTVRYGEITILKDIDWSIREGEHWALIGPNGAGKSTLLKLISGDNLQGYANDLVLFGRRKGTGESMWQVKQQIGMIDDGLQARYQRHHSGYDVICSGFFDSVGLYRQCTPEQHRIARRWIETLQLQELVDLPFARLSFGQQRLVLIARAMVKSPRLLILDEPCNGLDQTHRKRLLSLLDVIGCSNGRGTHTCLLYVSHRRDEMPACITHRLHLEGGRVQHQSNPGQCLVSPAV